MQGVVADRDQMLDEELGFMPRSGRSADCVEKTVQDREAQSPVRAPGRADLPAIRDSSAELSGTTTRNLRLAKSIDTRLNARIAFIPRSSAGRSFSLSLLKVWASANTTASRLRLTPPMSSSRTNR